MQVLPKWEASQIYVRLSEVEACPRSVFHPSTPLRVTAMQRRGQSETLAKMEGGAETCKPGLPHEHHLLSRFYHLAGVSHGFKPVKIHPTA